MAMLDQNRNFGASSYAIEMEGRTISWTTTHLIDLSRAEDISAECEYGA